MALLPYVDESKAPEKTREILNRGPNSEAFHSAAIQPLRSKRWRAG